MLVLVSALCVCVRVCACLEEVKQSRSPFQSSAPSHSPPTPCLLFTSPYLLLDIVDLCSQPLDHPVHLRDLMLGVAKIITMPASCLLQLLILGPAGKRKGSIYMMMETLSQHSQAGATKRWQVV